MVDVEGLRKFNWRLVDTGCSCASEVVNNFEWNVRETLSRILLHENIQYESIFEEFPDLVFHSVSSNIQSAVDNRMTFGVYTVFKGHELFHCPVLMGSKMFQIIEERGRAPVDINTWKEYIWKVPRCLLCCKTEYVLTMFIVKGRLYNLGSLAWTNYERVIWTRKQNGIVLFRKQPNAMLTEGTCPLIKDFVGMKNLLTNCIGNKKLASGGYIFPQLFRQTIRAIMRVCESKRGRVYVKAIINETRKNVHTGRVDSVIGQATAFNFHNGYKTGGVNSEKHYNVNNVGRYKVLNKLDATATTRAFQLDTLTKLYSKKIKNDLRKEDIGFLDLVTTSESAPGITGLELVLGTFISSPNDVMSFDDLVTTIGRAVGDNLIRCSDNENGEAPHYYYVIINQTLFKHVKLETNLDEWVATIRPILKNIRPCVEVYKISERLYYVLSIPQTIFKIYKDGYVYSAMEVATSSTMYNEILQSNVNIHGPSAVFVFNLNSNHLVRNATIINAVRQCVTGMSSGLLKNETIMLKGQPMVGGIPFYCIKANVLVLPMEYNVEDACVLNAKSVFDKNLFTILNKVTTTVQLEGGVEFTRPLIVKFPTTLRAGIALLKYKCENTVRIGKHLNVKTDVLEGDNDIMVVTWNPNNDLIGGGVVCLESIRIHKQDGESFCYCDFQVSYYQRATLGTKLFILNGGQKMVVGKILRGDRMPRLYNSPSISDPAMGVDVDIVQHPFSLKRLSFNFLYTPDICALYNECFDTTPEQKLHVLLNKRMDYYVNDPTTNRFYVDEAGWPIKALLYQAFVVLMNNNNPHNLLHKADENTTRNEMTNQPQVNYQRFHTTNNNCYGLTDAERDVLVGLGLNSFIELMGDLSDSSFCVLENSVGERVCVPMPHSATRVMDMLRLAGINIGFSVKDVE